MYIENSEFNASSFTVSSTKPAAVEPRYPSYTMESSLDIKTNRLYFSKVDQPKHVPVVNYINVGEGTARILARGLGLPQVQPVLEPVALLTLSASGPVRGNMRDGLVTGGHFQYDRVSSDDGPVEANHDNLSLSEESSTQFLHFLQSWLEDGVPEIIDPYSVLETSPLP